MKRRQLCLRLASYLWDAGGRHWGELGDVGPLHSCVGRNILSERVENINFVNFRTVSSCTCMFLCTECMRACLGVCVGVIGTDCACAAQGQVAQLLGERSHHRCGLDGHGMIHCWSKNCTL